MSIPLTPRPLPLAGEGAGWDQAEGLRQLFAGSRTRFVPLVSNPHLAFGGVVLERLASAFAELVGHTLVVDAGEHARAPSELALLELADGIEQLSPQLSYLAARGLPLRHVDAQGSSARFLHALAEAAPRAGVVLVHASASELARMFAHRIVRPLLLAEDRPEAVTHAYAGLKLLALRANLMAHDLLLAAAEHSPRAQAIARQLAHCADTYLGAALHDWVQIDPATSPHEASSTELRRLVRGLLMACEPGTASAPPVWNARHVPWTTVAALAR